MKQPIILFIFLFFLIAGCQINNEFKTTDPEKVDPEDLPKVKAFEDEFTRGFLQSTEETREGFYPFLSGTRRYKMDFPAQAVMDERGYYLQDETEKFSLGVNDENANTRINITYLHFMTQKSMKSRLQTISENSDTPLNFKKKELEGRLLQKAFYKDKYGYFGYVIVIQNTQLNGAIEISTVSECKDNRSNCDQVIQDIKTTYSKWLESIVFLSNQ